MGKYLTINSRLEVVSRSSGNTRDAFFYETAQLTEAFLDNLTELEFSNISLFNFANNSESHLPASGECKTYPGDSNWPTDATWNVLDQLLDGALIKTKPVASPCYQNWGDYDEVECAWLTANWGNDSYFQ